MTPAQRVTLRQLEREGFRQIVEGGDVVRVTRHADCRIIFTDGQQKRAHHVERGQPKPREAR